MQSDSIESGEDSSGIAALQALGADLGLDDSDDVPHPDKAFMLSVRIDSNDIIQANILLGNNIYLYRDKIRVELIEGNGHQIGPIALPKGKLKNDAFFGETEVIYDEVEFAIPIVSENDASNRFVLAMHYQGCIEDRICYPPVVKHIEADSAKGLIHVSQQEVDP